VPVHGVVSFQGGSQGRHRGLAQALQQGPASLKPGQDDPKGLREEDRQQSEPGGHPQGLSDPKKTGRAKAFPCAPVQLRLQAGG